MRVQVPPLGDRGLQRQVVALKVDGTEPVRPVRTKRGRGEAAQGKDRVVFGDLNALYSLSRSLRLLTNSGSMLPNMRLPRRRSAAASSPILRASALCSAGRRSGAILGRARPCQSAMSTRHRESACAGARLGCSHSARLEHDAQLVLVGQVFEALVGVGRGRDPPRRSRPVRGVPRRCPGVGVAAWTPCSGVFARVH